VTGSGKLWLAFVATMGWLAAFAASRPCEAHQVGLSRGDYSFAAGVLTAELTFARGELTSALPELDGDKNGTLTPAELAAGAAVLDKRVVEKIRVQGDATACKGALDRAQLAEEDGLTVRVTFRCEGSLQRIAVDLALLEDLPHGHRHIARSAEGSAFTESVLFKKNRAFHLAASGGGANAEEKGAATGRFGFLLLGIEHILTGYDHLVFLFALILVGGRLRSLLLVVTAFTVAHSITLALAVLGVWAPSPRIVEPLIALSIAYVGVENFFAKDADKRWRVTFPFGLVHGFGFAGALQEVAMPRGDVAAALVLFNAGVEIGQLAVLALLLPLVLAARRSERFRKVGALILSGGVVLAGLAWFVLRITSS
jgi:hypothetical protein